MTDSLLDATISHAIDLQGFERGTTNDVLAILNQSDADIYAAIIAGLQGVDQSSTVEQVDSALAPALAILAGLIAAMMRQQQSAMVVLIGYELEFQRDLLQSVTGKPITAPPAALVQQVIQQSAADGLTPPEWGQSLSDAAVEEVKKVARVLVQTGAKPEEVADAIVGKPEAGFSDGEMQKVRRDAEAIIRTLQTHAVEGAKQILWKNNPQAVARWQFVAILDGRTTLICRGLHGSVYPVGTGPVPPRHIRCRSAAVPIPPGAEPPQVITGEEWLARQSPEVQREILGRTRFKLYTEGKYTLADFVRNSVAAYTIDELRAKDLTTFKRLGL